MLAKPEIKVLDALAALQDHQDFGQVLAWLRIARDKQSLLNDRQRDLVSLRFGQGAAQALTSLLDIVAAAPDTLRKLRVTK